MLGAWMKKSRFFVTRIVCGRLKNAHRANIGIPVSAPAAAEHPQESHARTRHHQF